MEIEGYPKMILSKKNLRFVEGSTNCDILDELLDVSTLSWDK